MLVTDVHAWLRSVPDVASRLAGEPPARVAWIGCDDADALVRVAHEYPTISVYASTEDAEQLASIEAAVRAGRVLDRVVVRPGSWVSGRLAGWIDVAVITTRLPDMGDWFTLEPALLALLRQRGVGFVRTTGYQPLVSTPPPGGVGAAPAPHLRTPEALPETLDDALWVLRRG